MKDQELEVKFYVENLDRIRNRLDGLGAELVQPRLMEINLRFDTLGRDLTQSGQALRLRQDSAARLTYKGPSSSDEGVRVRREIEFVVSDFDSASSFLEALGYGVMLIYEKYRTVYKHEGVLVSLDELPYGHFVEIEGEIPSKIHRVNDLLKLNWDNRIYESYTVLFERFRADQGYSFRDLAFKNFEGLTIQPGWLGVQAADS